MELLLSLSEDLLPCCAAPPSGELLSELEAVAPPVADVSIGEDPREFSSDGGFYSKESLSIYI